MNYRVVCRVLGLLTLLLAAFMLICEGYGFFVERIQNETAHDLALLKSFFVAAALGGILIWFGRKSGNEILRKEGIAIVGLGWIIGTLVGAIPYVLCQPAMLPSAAIFESASGFTTTGSSAIADLDLYLGPSCFGEPPPSGWEGWGFWCYLLRYFRPWELGVRRCFATNRVRRLDMAFTPASGKQRYGYGRSIRASRWCVWLDSWCSG